jgi:methyltransferase (TIGR00027 family)
MTPPKTPAAMPDVSRTAEYMALFRALESVKRPKARRLFEDPFAPLFLSRGPAAALAVARLPALGALVPWFIDRRWPGARSSGVARTRLIDDALGLALQDHVEQVVLLGAGFDCRALRLPHISQARVFEVDQAATLHRKVERLRRQRAALAERHVVRVALDFKRDALGRALIAAGFRADRRTFFVWEGVTNYLSAAAVDQVLQFVAHESAPKSRILFTYVHRGVIDGTVRFVGWDRVSRMLSRVGERWSFGIDPAQIAGFLAERGLRLIADIGAAEYRARYRENDRGYEFYRAALAEVGLPFASES